MRADVLVFDHSRFAFAALKAFLIQHGYRVILATNLSEVERKMLARQFDLVIVQESIRKEEILHLNEHIKTNTPNTYCFVLMQGYSVRDRIEILEAGTDDCLSIPYHPKELLLKLEKLLRHKLATPREVIQTTKYALDIRSGDLICPWGQISLRKKEFLILSVLLQQKNRVVPKEQLIERIWNLEKTPQLSTVDVHIRRIRQKLRDVEKKIIRTSYGIGYMFCE
jgi:DNA-binding response OmpR family regulator